MCLDQNLVVRCIPHHEVLRALQLLPDSGLFLGHVDLDATTLEAILPSYLVRYRAAGQFTREPVRTAFGWHVILVKSRSDTLVPTFEAVAADLREDLSRQVIRALLTRLRADAEIEILPDVTLPQPGPQSSGLITAPTTGEP